MLGCDRCRNRPTEPQAVTPEDAFDVAEAIGRSLNASVLIRGGG